MKDIPKIIHQTWKDSDIPEHFNSLIETWKVNHPTWKYKLWTDEMNRDFIKEYAPDFLDIYDNYPYNIQRVDAVRYFILYELGGVFIDLDFASLICIDQLLKDQSCVLGLEPQEHCESHKKEIIICNAFMACNQKNLFFKEICVELGRNNPIATENAPFWVEILESTGPFKLTEIYHNYKDKNEITLASSKTVYPLTLNELKGLITGIVPISKTILEKLNSAFAVHYFWGTWLR